MDPDLQRAAQALLKHTASAPARSWEFQPLKPPPQHATPTPTIAVDGSHAVLADNGAVWVVAVRAAAITWPGPRTGSPVQIRTHAATPTEAQAILDAVYTPLGIDAPRAASATAWAESLCAAAEASAAIAAIEAIEVGAGGQLLVDGALNGLPRLVQPLANRIKDVATRRAISLVAVAKRSGLESGGTPIIPFLQRTGPPGCWAVPVSPETFVARLYPLAKHAFRIDAPDIGAIARLLPGCRDAAYVGYPYALAVAHNHVAITATEVADLRGRLHAVLRASGGNADALLADFHDVLDRNVPR